MVITCLVPIHRDWTATESFQAANGLQDAVSQEANQFIEDAGSILRAAWPELAGVYADIWLTNTDGISTGSFRFSKAKKQLLINHSIDCSRLPNDEIKGQVDAIVGALQSSLVTALIKYGHQTAGEELRTLVASSVEPKVTVIEVGDIPDDGDSLLELIFRKEAAADTEKLRSICSKVATLLAKDKLAEFEGTSWGVAIFEAGFITRNVAATKDVIEKFLLGIGFQASDFYFEVDDS